MPDKDLEYCEDLDLVALARRGKDAWNEYWEDEWDRLHPDDAIIFDFSEKDLRDIPSFAGFKFPGKADFSNATFHGWDASNGDVTNFIGAVFSHEPNFYEAKFEDGADFTGAEFFTGAYFVGAKFCDKATFSGVRFPKSADFRNAKFSFDADFAAAKFFGIADFSKAEFFSLAGFSNGSFFQKALFNETSFYGEADFSNRKFKGLTSFRKAAFSRAPRFHGSSIYQGTDFGNINDTFTDFRSHEAEQCYRTLKLAMGEQQARTEEAAFAALELKSRRYRLNSEARNKKLGLQRFLSWAERCGYWFWDKFSDSGRSFLRPFGLYVASLLGSAALYVSLPICKVWFPIDMLNWGAGFRYAFLRQFSFVAALRGGSDRIRALEKKLFYLNEAGLPPWWVDVLNSAQSITALVLIFLMGLGIRHKFRLR